MDLAQFIIDSQPLRVSDESVSADNNAVVDNDNISISIKFAHGSLGVILYLANGDTAKKAPAGQGT